MEKQLWKICAACSDIAVEGCESMDDEQVANWYTDKKVVFDEPNECGSMVNYVQIPINNLDLFIPIPAGTNN